MSLTTVALWSVNMEAASRTTLILPTRLARLAHGASHSHLCVHTGTCGDATVLCREPLHTQVSFWTPPRTPLILGLNPKP